MSANENSSTHSMEKTRDVETVMHIEQVEKHIRMGISPEDAAFYENFPPDARKTLIRKVRLCRGLNKRNQY